MAPSCAATSVPVETHFEFFDVRLDLGLISEGLRSPDHLDPVHSNSVTHVSGLDNDPASAGEGIRTLAPNDGKGAPRNALRRPA